MNEDETEFKHPSYVLVSFSRRQGNPGQLFGSSLKQQYNYITLQVREGTRIHDNRLGVDRYFGPMSGTILEIDMSAAQFAELITTMNIGCGVPGTLRRFQGKAVEKPPTETTEAEKVRANFRYQMKKFTEKAREVKKSLDAMLDEKATISKADRKSIKDKIGHLIAEFETYAPYIHERFEEAVEKTVNAAKTEIDSFITTAAVMTGFKQLRENSGQHPLLGSGEDVSEDDEE